MVVTSSNQPKTFQMCDLGAGNESLECNPSLLSLQILDGQHTNWFPFCFSHRPKNSSALERSILAYANNTWKYAVMGLQHSSVQERGNCGWDPSSTSGPFDSTKPTKVKATRDITQLIQQAKQTEFATGRCGAVSGFMIVPSIFSRLFHGVD